MTPDGGGAPHTVFRRELSPNPNDELSFMQIHVFAFAISLWYFYRDVEVEAFATKKRHHQVRQKRHVTVLSDGSPSVQGSVSRDKSVYHERRRALLALFATEDGDVSSFPNTNTSRIKEVTGVTLKMAFDSSPVWGVADLSETKSERFTSPESLDMVHRLRRESSAVLVGRGTVEYDNCSLTVRRVELGEGEEQPVRVVLDPSLSLLGRNYTIFSDGYPTVVYHLQSGREEEISREERDFVTFVEMPNQISMSTDNDKEQFTLSPQGIIDDLAKRGLNHIMVEGGAATARAFLNERAVDRAILVRASVEFQEPKPAQIDEDTLKAAELQMIGTTNMGSDIVEYWSRNELPWPDSTLPMWP